LNVHSFVSKPGDWSWAWGFLGKEESFPIRSDGWAQSYTIKNYRRSNRIRAVEWRLPSSPFWNSNLLGFFYRHGTLLGDSFRISPLTHLLLS
jgi:hypothetical protein